MPPLWVRSPALSALTADGAASLGKAAEESRRDPIRNTLSVLHCSPEPTTDEDIPDLRSVYASNAPPPLFTACYRPTAEQKPSNPQPNPSPLVHPPNILLV